MRNFIPISQPTITDRELNYITAAVKSGWISSLGKYIIDFEAKFAAFIGVKYSIAVSNGTSALHLALLSYDIKDGDEVIVPDFTFIATANAVCYTRANPAFVDIEEDTLCINPEKIEQAITNKTKAIIPVHIYGHPANMIEINKIAKKYNLIVIEDAAEAHGAQINGQMVGSFGQCAAFSFYGNKIITTGEGGIITTNNADKYEKMLYLRDHAMHKKKRYWHDEIGYNYRITNLQAAIGLAQLERIDDIIKKKRHIFTLYKNRLASCKGIRLNHEALWAKNVFWTVCLEHADFDEIRRDAFMLELRDRGIDSRPYFYPISDMPMFQKADTPVAHAVGKRGINMPSFYDLTDDTIEYICDTILSILQ